MKFPRSIGVRGSTCLFICLSLAGSLQAAGESRFVSIGGVRLQYTDWGGVGEPLIFIPGGCDTAFVFGDVASGLSSRFRVVGLTARGCGASDRPASGYGMETQISDIVGFMDALSIARATFIGHSSGGGKITQLALRYPGRVHRLIYLDTVFRYVAAGLEEMMDAGIARAVGGQPLDSLDLWKRTARMWELGPGHQPWIVTWRRFSRLSPTAACASGMPIHPTGVRKSTVTWKPACTSIHELSIPP